MVHVEQEHEMYSPAQLYWRQISIPVQGEHKTMCKIESHEETRQDAWGFWLPGYLVDLFLSVQGKLVEGHSGYQLPSH